MSPRNIQEYSARESFTFLRLVWDQAGVTPDVAKYKYPGQGTSQSPFLVAWPANDARNPYNFSATHKWFVTFVVALATLSVAFVSSAYTGGIAQITDELDVSQEVGNLGVSLFVLGFAVGPLLWAPLSELYGRRILFLTTYAGLTAFNAGCVGAQNAQTLLVLRFFAGAFGSSPLTNAGGSIADMFSASERGIALALFAAAPFLGPILGPVIGGFIGLKAGWRWVMGFLAIFSGSQWIMGILFLPETYGPVLLRHRAAKLSAMTGKHFVSKLDHDAGKISLSQSIRTALSRPWVLLFREPIVLLLSIYMAIIYGTLFMLFAAFPIVFQSDRGWNQGVGGLSFLGIMVGMICAIALIIPINSQFVKIQDKHGGKAPPEARLLPALVGCVALPLGLFWFSWTNSSSVHWIVSIAAGFPFGFGMVLVFLGVLNYLIDSYTIFAASALAANSVLRSLFGAIFPTFTTYMYDGLGIHWASSVPAFLALACVPFPYLFYRYGASIRARCKFAAESAEFLSKLSDSANQGTRENLELNATNTANHFSVANGDSHSEEIFH